MSSQRLEGPFWSSGKGGANDELLISAKEHADRLLQTPRRAISGLKAIATRSLVQLTIVRLAHRRGISILTHGPIELVSQRFQQVG